MKHDLRSRILIVDDTRANLKILGACLRDRYAVSVATSGRAALEVARSRTNPPDLILLDIVMPDMDGYEVCRLLKADPQTARIPVVFVSALSETGDEARGLGLGAVDYITKPFSASIVRARVKNHLELKHAREELERQNEILREYNRMREDMERISRHDMRTPLNAIINLPQLILEEEERDIDEDLHDCLTTVMRAGYRLLDMINLSLDLVKMEQGTYALKPESVDIAATLRKVATDLETLSRGMDVGVDIDVTYGERPVLVLAEELLCYSMMANLIKNAIEASPAGETVRVQVQAGPLTKVVVHNRGAVPEAARANFFEKYNTVGKEGGTGLGTYSARLIAETLGGGVAFETSEAEGTRVTVSLLPFAAS
ncbi:Hybrid sensor histidine kinase/response regulator [Sulfidibacter corallicola]|uniref:histidine kinase n=1 Tax=Sulfidibacter corallicola TaxID=2818388 RepID=A0A8A4TUP2_SULCO|nr:hybrid sensor histidine kinase/response regulator [Sulfidibacter corallicola]QTD50245.1 hybrid sensor histidine kinase/response regulator [Sulfidibacter corallicola]